MHGSCIDLINAYRCDCNKGYTGINCEEEINECEEYKPCQHGDCVDGIADYTCQCEEGYGGKNCSVTLIGKTSRRASLRILKF